MLTGMRRILVIIRRYGAEKRVVWLRSKREVEQFLIDPGS